MDSPDQYAVMGNPIAHSKSPRIHRQFAEQTGQQIEYRALRVDEGDFEQALEHFFKQGKGLNITVPFKQRAWQLSGRLSERAQLAGAVNTLWMEGGVLVGDNTDGCGLVTDLVQNQRLLINAKRVLLLGAGGAARGVLQPLLAEGPAKLVVANRTLARAQELVELFSPFGVVEASSFEALRGAFDLIINATSASLEGEVPPLPPGVVAGHTHCYDMMYGAEPTAFNRWAKSKGAKDCIDGLGMLVEQAAEAFYLWRGVRPDTQPVLAALRAEMGQT
ncbi:shikimate dehydrogenase [Aestuariirhabdus litorea]|uniref:Shikimate dehydrogenase (NADP(+)) n=1 Tax=Aestuariirhabdus litorea TaxID=2528527 RepID=A0A3P3VLH6_9GAMM|nr:shikimate dehydrogenase [Aestuariirhabdus litorea]RRJ82576.1 shikimate dehydrogenase [Aestuariirhabdus litorea]RWW93656.1 shikimate dehydrogenase [Endozoicomonadaceae bacterium GTF-13]